MIDWTNDKSRRLGELISDPQKLSESQIATKMTDEFGEEFSRDSVHNKILRLNLRTLLERPVPDYMPYYNKYRSVIEAEDDGVPKNYEKIHPSYVDMPKDKFKILHLGDPHIPFQDDNELQTAINRNLTADLVVTTEVLDCYAISRFNKNLSVPFEIELDNAIRYFEMLNEVFPLTFVMGGNHDKRIGKDFMKGVRPELLFLAETNLFKVLAKPFPNIIVFEQPVLQVNDCVFTHAEYFSKVDLKAGVNVYNFLTEWKESLDLKPYRTVIQSHTHMLGATYRGGNTKIMESGCLCRVPDYAATNFYGKPQTNGYIVVNQEKGVTNFDTTREYVFPTQKYVPAWNPIKEK